MFTNIKNYLNKRHLVIIPSVLITIILPVFLVLSKSFININFNSEAVHSSVEMANSISILLLAGIYLMQLHYENKGSYKIWVVSAFLAIGIPDIFHSFVSISNSFVWYYSLGNITGGILFSLVWLPVSYKLKKIVPILTLCIISILCLSDFCCPILIPSMLVSAGFSVLACIFNLVSGIFFFVASIYFLKMFLRTSKFEAFLLMNFCFLFGSSGIIFQWSEVWGLEWWVWHVLRMFASLSIVIFILFLFNKAINGLKKRTLKLLSQQKQLEFAVYHDNLTKVNNRLSFDNEFKLQVSKTKKCSYNFAILFIDVDNFKSVNDNYGHDTGDFVLQTIANKLSKLANDNAFVARIGGDEFAIIYSNILSQEEAYGYAKNAMELITSQVEYKGYLIDVSISIGVSTTFNNKLSVDNMIKFSDFAMHKAKSAGKGCIKFYTDETGSSLTRQTKIIQSLTTVVENKELDLKYQPIIDLKSEKIVGCEALLRWQHLELGNIAPNEFIHFAESSSVINQICLWEIEEICKQIKHDNAFNQGIFYSTNISPSQLSMPKVAYSIREILNKYEINPKQIVFELTEGRLTNHMTKFKNNEFINTLTKTGSKLSIDDFGSGHSSMSRLAELPISTLKIDGVFMQQINKSPKYKKIIKGIIALAKSLKMKVTAEHIASAEDREFLLANNCDYAQGHYYYEALSSKEFSDLIKNPDNKI